jgi:orotate phosphoribosyltransferase
VGLTVPDRVREIFEACGAVRRGHFRVRAGQHTAEFWEKFAVLREPALADELCALLARRLAPLRPTIVAGPTQGGLLVAWGVARHLGCRAMFLERESREDPFTILRGSRLDAGDVVVLVDDLISSGGTVHRALRPLLASPATVAGVGCWVDRRSTVPPEQVRPLPEIEALLTLTSPPSYPPADCPLCPDGPPLLDPRSMRPV